LKLKSISQKLSIIGTGHTVNFLINSWFDYIVYVPVVAYFGPIKGCGIMIVISVLLNLTLIKVYDKTEKDWLGFEALKEGREKFSEKLPKWVSKLINLGDTGAFIGLSLYDPFLATIYLRKLKNAHKGLTGRDWRIFVSATLLSNVGWTGIVYGGISSIQWFIKTVHLF
jgi:hypothetical protein